MTAKAGEIACETAVYRCQNCHQHVSVNIGLLMPDCPNCGNEGFDTGWRTLRNQPATEERYAASGALR